MRNLFILSTITTGAMVMLTACGSSTQVADADATPNTGHGPAYELLQQNVDATLWYRTSEEMARLYLQGYDLARMYVDENMRNPFGDGSPVVILDLDETVLDNSDYFARLIVKGEVPTEESWHEWERTGTPKALPGAAEFVNYCHNLGVEVYYISNRSVENLAATRTQLQNLGFHYADEQHMLLKMDTDDKSERRLMVMDAHNVILIAGDSSRDLTSTSMPREELEHEQIRLRERMGDDYERQGTRFVIFPNPMYGAWQKPYRSGDFRETARNKVHALDQSMP